MVPRQFAELCLTVLRKTWGRLPELVRRTVGLRAVRRSAASRRAVTRHNARLPSSSPTLAFFPMQPSARAHLLDVLALAGVRVGTELFAEAAEPGPATPSKRIRRRTPRAVVRWHLIIKNLVRARRRRTLSLFGAGFPDFAA